MQLPDISAALTSKSAIYSPYGDFSAIFGLLDG